MHTDEYEISLFRELEVCKNAIGKIRKELRSLEKKYGLETEKFLSAFGAGTFRGGKDDGAKWIEKCNDLKRWEEHQNQYQSLFKAMKI
jgi:hypothetical protein